MSDATVLVACEGITKAYPGVLACDGIDLDVRSGEVHALLGENGAGKSTLMGILFGLHQPDRGRILFQGQTVRIRGPRDATALGIGFVQQHFSSVPTMTVAENMALALRGTGRAIPLRRCVERVAELSSRYGLGIEPRSRVEQLSVGAQQRVELLKALALDPRVLILDEPSALLSPQESQELRRVMRRMADEDMAILLISHKLEEVLSVSDRISVLRRGRKVRTLDADQADQDLLARLMVGDLRRSGPTVAPYSPQPPDASQPSVEPGLRLDGIVAVGDRGETAVRGVSLSVARGEIVGLAGLDGSGQVELIEVVAGVRAAAKGTVHIGRREIGRQSVRGRQHAGVAHVPADRRRDGVVGSLSVAENLVLSELHEPSWTRWGVLRTRAIRTRAEALIGRYDIRVAHPGVPASALSGGNQQKVVLARELSRDPDVIACAYPTWGLDFGAAAAIHDELRRRRAGGAAILVASVDLDELLAVCDRIAVMQGGRILGEVAAASATPGEIGRMMGGVEAT